MKKYIIYLLGIILICLGILVYQKQKVTISVIVPVYNAEKYISKCLDSILSQDGNFEVVVINDGSTDSSLKILQEYTEKYKKIKLINQTNQGVSSARNAGIKASTAKYITFVDSDDWLEPNVFAKSIKILQKDKSDILLTSYFDVYDRDWVKNVRGEEDAQYAPEIRKYPSRTFDKLSLFSPFYAKDAYSDLYYSGTDIRGKFYLKEFLDNNNIIFTPDIKCAEDIIFNFQSFLHNPKISILNEPIYNYHNRVDSVSKSIDMIKWSLISTSKMQQKEEYKKASRNIQMLIDDSLLFLINIGISNASRQNKAFDDMKPYVLEAYRGFDKYNSLERKSLRNYLKLHQILYGNTLIQPL